MWELLHRPARSRGRDRLKHSLRGSELPTKGERQSHWLLHHLFNIFNTKGQISVCVLHLVENVRLIISHLWRPKSTVSHSLTLIRGDGELFQSSFPLYPLCPCSAASCPGYRAQEDCSEMGNSITRGHRSPGETAPGNMSF